MYRRLFTIIAALLLAESGPVAACELDDALEIADKGALSFHDGQYADAITLFDQAYECYPEPLFLFNKGRTYQKLGHANRALEFYKAFLELPVSEEDREDAETFKKQIVKAVSSKKQYSRVLLEGGSPGDDVYLDGVYYGAYPVTALHLRFGSHTVGYQTLIGNKTELTFTVDRQGAHFPQKDSVSDPFVINNPKIDYSDPYSTEDQEPLNTDVDRNDMGWMVFPGWGLSMAGVAMLVIAGVVDYSIGSDIEEYKNLLKEENSESATRLRQEISDQQSKAKLLYIFGGISVAAGVTFLVIYFLSDSPADIPEDKSAFSLTPVSDALILNWSLSF